MCFVLYAAGCCPGPGEKAACESCTECMVLSYDMCGTCRGDVVGVTDWKTE